MTKLSFSRPKASSLKNRSTVRSDRRTRRSDGPRVFGDDVKESDIVVTIADLMRRAPELTGSSGAGSRWAAGRPVLRGRWRAEASGQCCDTADGGEGVVPVIRRRSHPWSIGERVHRSGHRPTGRPIRRGSTEGDRSPVTRSPVTGRSTRKGCGDVWRQRRLTRRKCRSGGSAAFSVLEFDVCLRLVVPLTNIQVVGFQLAIKFLALTV